MRLAPFTAKQSRLYLPQKNRDIAKDRWVQQQQTKTHQSINDAPFPRMIDFWFASIVVAAGDELPLPKKVGGVHFVTVGPNKSDVQRFPDFWAQALTLLAVKTWGYDNPACTEPTEVIALGNLFAEVGSSPLLDALEQSSDMASARLYVLADIFTDKAAVILDRYKKNAF